MLSHQWVRVARSIGRGISTKPYYITTPIFYPNAVPHIGHLYSLVTADIFARFNRLKTPERPVLFLAGTDEHGLKIQKAAKDKGLPPLEFCDQISEQFRKLATTADISNTMFMRTTSREHHLAVEDVWRKLASKDLIYKTTYSGWYSISDEAFYPESQITRLPASPQKDTETMISTETGSLVEWHSEQNYMFRLSNFRNSLLEHYRSHPGSIFPPQHYEHVISMLEGPLEDLSISRPRSRLEWGVRVPGDDEQTVYVWFDALLVYLSGVGYPWAQGVGEKGGWPANLQIVGKDIVRFHAIYLPAMLQALEIPLPSQLLAHAHWTVQQKKMSKSIGNVADPFDTMREFGVDVVRWYLGRVGGRFRTDVDWSHEQLTKYNDEIQAQLGNFFLRITSDKIIARMRSDGARDDVQVQTIPDIDILVSAVTDLGKDVESCLTNFEVADAIQHIVDLLKMANSTLSQLAPWSSNSSPQMTRACYETSLEVLRVSGICLQPFVPALAGRLLDALGVGHTERSWQFSEVGRGKLTEGGVKRGVRLFEGFDSASKKAQGKGKSRK